MNGERYIKQALVAALVGHPEQEKYKARAFSGDNIAQVMQAWTDGGNRLVKADFFAKDDTGKPFVDTPGLWQNFDKVVDAIHKAGERLGADDFLRVLNPGTGEQHTLLDNAASQGGMEKVFSVPVWQGHFDEMECLWYKAPHPARATMNSVGHGQIPYNLKKDLLEAEGRTMPEERLKKADLTRERIFETFAAPHATSYGYIVDKLEKAGDYLRKDYLMLPDNDGDTLFHTVSAWEKYDDIVKGMEKHGERFEVSDFLRQVGTRPNILTRAAEKKSLDKVFNPDHWAGNLGGMLELWSHVPDGWKTAPLEPKDFDSAYARAESKVYGQGLDFAAVGSREDLLRPVNAPEGNAKPVLPLGLRSFWDHSNEIQGKLAAHGEKITLADLRQPSGELGYSALIQAAKSGNFSKALDIVKKSGDVLTVDDFLTKDRHGNTLLNVLGDRQELSQAFTPDLWVGRVAEMQTLWARVRGGDRGQVDIGRVEVAVRQETLMKGVDGRFRLKPRPGSGEKKFP